VADVQDKYLYLELDNLDGTEALTVRFIDLICFRRQPLLFIVASLTTQWVTDWKLGVSTNLVMKV
jgi:hypothetical protein